MTDQELTLLLREAASGVGEGDRTADCPPPADLTAFAMRELVGEPGDRIRLHLADCTACAAQVARLYRAGRYLEKNRQGIERSVDAISTSRRPTAPPRGAGRSPGLLLFRGWKPLALAVGLAVAGMVYLAQPHGSPADRVYQQVSEAASRQDLQAARMALHRTLPELFREVERGNPARYPDTGTRPNDTAFLSHDPIPFSLGKQAGPETGQVLRVVELEPDPGRVALEHRLSGSGWTAQPPSSGWRPGTYDWAVTGSGGLAGQGRFQVLSPEVAELVARAEREHPNDPERLARFYGMLGLMDRFRKAAAKLPPERRKALEAKLRPSPSPTGDPQ